MSLKILIDMNLSPQWVNTFKEKGIDAVHWSKIGDYMAKDRVIMEWARQNERVVFTHDLDFGTLLALTQATAPSVIQMRTQNVLPEYLGTMVVSLVKKYENQLRKGALMVIDDVANRVRILPLRLDTSFLSHG